MKGLRVLLALVLILTLVPMASAQAEKPMDATTTHVLDTTNTVVDGWMLGWVGEIDVDGDGVADYDIVWWLELDTWTFTGKASHYANIGQIWDTYPTGEILLVSEGHGKTTMPNTSWVSNGVVTYAEGFFAGWEGRRVHESGRFDTTVFPFVGESIFRLN